MKYCGFHCRGICVIIGVAAIAWIFRIVTWQWWLRKYDGGVPPVSYDGRIVFDLRLKYLPMEEQQIVDFVRNAHDNGKNIRVLADGHSWSEIAQTQDLMISLANYKGLVSYDMVKKEATFKAGTPLREISETLDELDLAMIQLGSVAGQSIAGAISTGTHGTGITIGNMATLVTKLKFVSGKGEVIELSEGDPDFEAAQVSIGLFGVITEVTLKVRDKFKLKELRHRYRGGLTKCLEDLPTLATDPKYTYVKMWVEFYNDFCILFQTEPTNDRIKCVPSDLLSFLTYYSFAIVTRITYLLPQLTSPLMFLVDWVGFGIPTDRVDNSYLILNDYFELPVHQEGEVVVDFEHAVDAVKAIREVVLSQKHPVNYITEVRFVAGDDIWLSPNYNASNGVCAITLTIYAPPEVAESYFKAAYKATKEYGARFHWGKHFYAKRAELDGLFPKLNDFAVLREKYDPKGVFINDFIEDRLEFKRK